MLVTVNKNAYRSLLIEAADHAAPAVISATSSNNSET